MREDRFMNRNKTATVARTPIKCLMLFVMAGFLFTTWAQAADRSSARKDLLKARDEWVQELEVQCGINDGIVKDKVRCAGAKQNLTDTEFKMTQMGITFTSKSQSLLKQLNEEGEESNDPKVLHKIIQELKAKNKALKAQASGVCSAASQTEKDIKKKVGLGGNSDLGQQGDDADADLANRHHGRAFK
jgi:hypothetical protein